MARRRACVRNVRPSQAHCSSSRYWRATAAASASSARMSLETNSAWSRGLCSKCTTECSTRLHAFPSVSSAVLLWSYEATIHLEKDTSRTDRRPLLGRSKDPSLRAGGAGRALGTAPSNYLTKGCNQRCSDHRNFRYVRTVVGRENEKLFPLRLRGPNGF